MPCRVGIMPRKMEEKIMSQAREDQNETIRLNRFLLEEEEMLDIRFYRNTKNGPKPTNRGIAIKQGMMTKLIWALQNVRSEIQSEAAKKEAGVL